MLAVQVPSSIYDSSEYVMRYARDVSINDAKLAELAPRVLERFEEGFDSVDDAFGSTDDLEKDINLVFFETAANFCFWAQDPKDKWQITHNGDTSGGWYGLRNAFSRALTNNVPIYDTRFVSELSLDTAADLFRGENSIQIPLLEWRVNALIEAARFLLNNHSGSAAQFIAKCQYDAPTIAQEVTRSLSSYRDGAWYQDQWVWILKRAQILPNDLAQLSQKYPEFRIKNVDKLTIFADYRLPQILRQYGVLQYSDKLAEYIDTKSLIPNGSAEEIEIRAATILACKKLGKLLPSMSIADIDVSLWLISQDMRNDATLLPHHLTVSYYY